MGKIKVRMLGDENLENKQKQQAKQKGHEKKLVKGGKGGERIVSVGPSEEELARQALEKKMKFWKNLPVLEFKKKAFEFLMRKGFEYEVVKDVLDKFNSIP